MYQKCALDLKLSFPSQVVITLIDSDSNITQPEEGANHEINEGNTSIKVEPAEAADGNNDNRMDDANDLSIKIESPLSPLNEVS